MTIADMVSVLHARVLCGGGAPGYPRVYGLLLGSDERRAGLCK